MVHQTWDLWTGEARLHRCLSHPDGAKGGDQFKRWYPPSTDFASYLGPTLLKARARDAARNNPFASRAVNLLRDYVVSIGIKPMVDSPDPALRALVHANWTKWTDSSDWTGRSSFYGQQAEAFRTCLIDGEVLALIRPGANLQIQILPCEFLDTTRDNAVDIGGGIQYDGEGRRVGYYLYQKNPAEALNPISMLVPADRVIHLYSPLQPGYERGVTWLAPALLALYELQSYLEASLVRAKTGSLFCGFVRSADGTPVLVDDQGTAEFEPGSIARLRPGDELQFTTPPDPTQGYTPFVATQLRAISSALGVPYELLCGDLSQITFASGREGLLAFERTCESLVQNLVAFQFCKPIWNWWLKIQVATGALPEEILTAPVRWVAPPIETLDSRMATQSMLQKIRSGLMSRSEAVAGTGVDPEALDRQIAADNARADSLGLIFDSDPRKVNLQGMEQPSDAQNSTTIQ